MVLEGGIVDGSTRLMLRMLAEDLLRAGIGPDRILDMSRNPAFQALHAARLALGDLHADREILDAAARVGTARLMHWETTDRFTPATLTINAGGTAPQHGE
jgi:hypothetical protein